MKIKKLKNMININIRIERSSSDKDTWSRLLFKGDRDAIKQFVKSKLLLKDEDENDVMIIEEHVYYEDF